LPGTLGEGVCGALYDTGYITIEVFGPLDHLNSQSLVSFYVSFHVFNNYVYHPYWWNVGVYILGSASASPSEVILVFVS